VDVPVAGTTLAGPAELIAIVQSAGGAAPTVALAPVEVLGRPHVFSATPTTIKRTDFADGIALLGFDLRADGQPWTGGVATSRQRLEVTLYWKAAGPTPRPLKVTVQLLSSANRLLAQSDSEPADGAAPTTSWVAGEVVASHHALNLAGLPAGADRLIVALYDPSTGARVAGPQGDAVVLTPVTVP
jgi:hypothetical protein